MIQKFVTTRGKLLNELLDLNHTRLKTQSAY
jgi:hypothetical protein